LWKITLTYAFEPNVKQKEVIMAKQILKICLGEGMNIIPQQIALLGRGV